MNVPFPNSLHFSHQQVKSSSSLLLSLRHKPLSQGAGIFGLLCHIWYPPISFFCILPLPSLGIVLCSPLHSSSQWDSILHSSIQLAAAAAANWEHLNCASLEQQSNVNLSLSNYSSNDKNVIHLFLFLHFQYR